MRKLAIPGQQYTDLCENWLMRYEKIDERFVLRLLVLRIDRRSFPKKRRWHIRPLPFILFSRQNEAVIPKGYVAKATQTKEK